QVHAGRRGLRFRPHAPYQPRSLRPRSSIRTMTTFGLSAAAAAEPTKNNVRLAITCRGSMADRGVATEATHRTAYREPCDPALSRLQFVTEYRLLPGPNCLCNARPQSPR